MTGTGNAIAARTNGAQSTAVAIRSGQVEFDDKQKSALVAMGVSEKATRAELAVFFHQCRNLRLDPFSKQIYLIHRRAREGDKWVEKPTTQIGIDGFRVIRDRISQERDLAISYEETIWYAEDGTAHDIWLWDEPPAACKFVVLVDDGRRVRRFPSKLRFNEYCQFGREDANGVRPRTGRWRDGHSHQIEKCAEADALRRAFPNDLSGVILEDAAPLSDPDAPPERQRVTGEQARARAPQQVRSEVVTVTPDPAPEDAPWPVDAAPARAARNANPETGEVIPDTGHDPRAAVLAAFDALKVAGPEIPGYLTRLSGHPYASVDSLSRKAAAWFADRLQKLGSRDELEAAAVAAEARREQDSAAEAGDAPADGEVPSDGQ